MAKAVEESPRPGLSRGQLALLALLVAALIASVALRALGRTRDGRTAAPAGGGNALVQDRPEAGEPEPEATPVERALPYVTEGSFFGLIGFALGYATRKFVKLGLVLLAIFFVGLQALVWSGTVTVDWGGLVHKLDAWVFNLRGSQSVTEFLTRRIPSGAGMLAGYWVGFRRG